nr:GGDEF domain-containing protein [Qaidamihabitans albus]
MVRNRAQDGVEARDCTDLLAVHESVADMFAAQGNWRRAYEHLRSALDLARETRSPQPHVPEQYRHEVEQLRRESLTDALTATFNRRYLDRRLVDLPAPAIALVDLDLFKRVNDTYGHQVGDQVLRLVVALLQQSLPPNGFCARYGGEEFVLVLPDTGLRAAVMIAERARARVAAHTWSRLRHGLEVTISAGVALRADTPGDPQEQLIEADSMLYAAKRAGRNLVAYRERERIDTVRTVRGVPFGHAREWNCAASLDRG